MLFDAGCVVCGAARGPLCDACADRLTPVGRLEVGGLDACRAGVRLEPTARELIAAFKYRGERRIAALLADLVADLVPRAADALTWLPTTGERRRRRGYDQSRELAEQLAARSDVPCVGLLGRRSGDDRQTAKSRAERLAGPDLVALGASPATVVVVDDVATTGSSLAVAASRLRQVGASRVVGLVAAATPLACGDRGNRLPAWK